MSDEKPQECMKGGKEKDGATTTDHSCTAYLLNNWGSTITKLTVKHTSGDNEDLASFGPLANGAKTDKMKIRFETGFGASHDYWYVRFEAADGPHAGTWRCKDNFYCDLRSDDEGTVVQLMLSGGDQDLYVTEASGQCYVSLSDVSSPAGNP